MPFQMNLQIGPSSHAFHMDRDQASPMQMAETIKSDGSFSDVPTYKLARQLAVKLHAAGHLSTADVRQSCRPSDTLELGFRRDEFVQLFGHLPVKTAVAIHRAPESKEQSNSSKIRNATSNHSAPVISASVDLSELALAQEMSAKMRSESMRGPSRVSVEAGTKQLAEMGVRPENMIPADKLKQFGNGSSHKLAYHISGETSTCFVSIPIAEADSLDRELKLYDRLKSAGVRIPRISKEKFGAVIDGVARYGVCMEKLDGSEYKQKLSWTFVKKQVEHFSQEQISNLKRTVDQFTSSGALVTDLQVFILNTTGEMVVFDPSTVSLHETPANKELRMISSQLARKLD